MGDPARQSLLDLTDIELDALVGPPAFRTRQLRAWLYERAVEDVEAMSDLPARVRTRLAAVGVGSLNTVDRQSGDDGMTIKWLFESHRTRFETVLMRYPKRATVCVSSQAGCAQGCPFCATGLGGFERHLSTGEIVEQVLVARRHLCDLRDNDPGDSSRSPAHVTNVVFMGMGEPLANYANVMSAIGRLNRDCQIGARSLTVSTIGIPARIRSLATDAPQVTLAWSLHAADDELRNRLVPPNKRWPIAAVLDSIGDYHAAGGRRVTIEYTLMRGVNDSPEQASALAALVGPLHAHVNLIAMNPVGTTAYGPSDPNVVAGFARTLDAAGINATVRANRGTDIGGACGQLNADTRR